MSKLRRVVWGMALLALVGTALGGTYWDGCNIYWNSTVVSNMTWGTYCGATGPGCEECYKYDGSVCYSRLPDRCGIVPQSPTR